MIEALILVPTHASDGTPLAHALHLEMRRRLVGAYGGLTRPREVDGIWVGPDGLEYSEAMIPYIAVLSSWWRLPSFLALAEWARDAFEQEVVAIRVAGIWEFWPKM